MIINITPAGVIESTLMYGIVHGVWLIIKRLGKEAYREARIERDKIIHAHVKAGHKSRLKHCVDDACINLQTLGPVQQSGQVPRTD